MASDRRHPWIDLPEHELHAMVDAAAPGRAVAAMERVSGGRCNTNLRVRLRGSRESLLLRIYSRGREVAEKELALHRRLAGIVPVPEPRCDSVFLDGQARPFALFEWIELPPLGDVLPAVDGVAAEAFGRSAGEVLARLGAIRFDAPGDLGPDLSVSPWQFPGAGSLMSFVTWCVSLEPVARRLGPHRCDRLIERVARDGDRLQGMDRECSLVHADFNPGNLLARGSGKAAAVGSVLDWEFAHSGSPMMDFGNLLRAHRALPAGFVDGFLDGFQSVAGPLPPDWFVRCRLVDLTAQLEFLTSTEDRGELHRVAIETIDSTLQD